jgi:hypothetical protein
MRETQTLFDELERIVKEQDEQIKTLHKQIEHLVAEARLAKPEQEPWQGNGGAGYNVGSGAQPEQEPVAWMEDSIEFYAKDHPTNSCTIPLYTAPPRKPWIGLTDGDMKNVWDEMKDAVCLDHKTFAHAISELLKEKNT